MGNRANEAARIAQDLQTLEELRTDLKSGSNPFILFVEQHELYSQELEHIGVAEGELNTGTMSTSDCVTQLTAVTDESVPHETAAPNDEAEETLSLIAEEWLQMADEEKEVWTSKRTA